MSTLRERQKARRKLVQALYSWDIGGCDVATVESQFSDGDDALNFDFNLFREILFGVVNKLAEIDGTFEPHLDRENKQLDPVSRAILRLSTYEMVYSIEVPFRVVINEGVNLAKTFGPGDAFKFINGVLDRVASDCRAIEISDNQLSEKV